MAGVRWLFKNLEEIVAGAFLVMMSLATFGNVLFRYFLNSPLAWAEEFARYAFVWLVFMGAALCTKHNRHITIDALLIALPRRAQAICNLLADLVAMGLMLVIIYYGLVLMSMATQPTSTLGIPQYMVYAAMPIAAVLVIYHSLGRMWGKLRYILGRGEGP
jgi:TRAP-type C4-dicarboxylate transport system permease small subunit